LERIAFDPGCKESTVYKDGALKKEWEMFKVSGSSLVLTKYPEAKCGGIGKPTT